MTQSQRKRSAVRWLVFWLVFQGVAVSYGLWLGWHNDREHLALVEAEAREEEVEQARACVDSHNRYANFLVLAERLTEAGAELGTDAHLALMNSTPEDVREAHALIDQLLPDRVDPIIDAYPPPECDLRASLELTQATDRLG